MIKNGIPGLRVHEAAIEKGGRRQYELSNHLGNVMATLSDVKTYAVGTKGAVGYLAKVTTAQQYYPFGMQMPGKNVTLASYSSLNRYRYGFNGQETETEINPSVTTAQFWEYDSRIGHRWNIDPVSYPWQSSYTTFNNNPILYADPLGLYGTKKRAEKMQQRAKDAGFDVGEVYKSESTKWYKSDQWGFAKGEFNDYTGDSWSHVFKQTDFGISNSKLFADASAKNASASLSTYDDSPTANFKRQEWKDYYREKEYNEKIFNDYGIHNPMSVGYSMSTAFEQGAYEVSGVYAINGIKYVYNTAKTFNKYRVAVKTLDFSTDFNGAVFYSGSGNKDIAIQFANEFGKKTIDMTQGGQVLNNANLYSNLPSFLADHIWIQGSKNFVNNASGTAFGFVKGANPKRVFNTYEFPALLQNPKINNVITGGY